MKIKDILNSKIGMPVDVTARLKKVFERVEREGEYGRYTGQNGILEDDTGSMRVQFSNFEDMKVDEGELLRLECECDKKGVLQGCSLRSYKDKEGKDVLFIKVTPMASIEDVAIEAPQTNGNAPVVNDQRSKQDNDRVMMMLIAYAKDLVGTLIASGVDPEEATNKGFEIVSRLYSKVTDLVMGSLKESLVTKQESNTGSQEDEFPPKDV